MENINFDDYSMRVSVKFDHQSLEIVREWTENNILNTDLFNKCMSEWVKELLKNNINDNSNKDDILKYKYRGKDNGFLNNMKHDIELKPLKFYRDPNINVFFFSSLMELRYKGVKELQGVNGKIKGELIIQMVENEVKEEK